MLARHGCRFYRVTAASPAVSAAAHAPMRAARSSIPVGPDGPRPEAAAEPRRAAWSRSYGQTGLCTRRRRRSQRVRAVTRAAKSRRRRAAFGHITVDFNALRVDSVASRAQSAARRAPARCAARGRRPRAAVGRLGSIVPARRRRDAPGTAGMGVAADRDSRRLPRAYALARARERVRSQLDAASCHPRSSPHAAHRTPLRSAFRSFPRLRFAPFCRAAGLFRRASRARAGDAKPVGGARRDRPPRTPGCAVSRSVTNDTTRFRAPPRDFIIARSRYTEEEAALVSSCSLRAVPRRRKARGSSAKRSSVPRMRSRARTRRSSRSRSIRRSFCRLRSTSSTRRPCTPPSTSSPTPHRRHASRCVARASHTIAVTMRSRAASSRGPRRRQIGAVASELAASRRRLPAVLLRQTFAVLCAERRSRGRFELKAATSSRPPKARAGVHRHQAIRGAALAAGGVPRGGYSILDGRERKAISRRGPRSREPPVALLAPPDAPTRARECPLVESPADEAGAPA